MTEPEHSLERLIHSGDEPDERQRAVYAGVLTGVGLVFAWLHAPHLVADLTEGHGLLAIATGAIFPLLLALVITAVGLWLWQSDLRATELRRIDLWCLLGIVGISVVSGVIVEYQLLEGAHLTHIRFIMLDFATAGGIAGILVGWYDVQNRRRAEQLRIFQKVVEHSGHCIYLTGPDGITEYVNPQFEAQTGYDRCEAIGKTPRLLKSGEHDHSFYEQMWETILAGEVWQEELVNQRKDGSNYYVDQTIAPVTNEAGEIERFVAINSDITERKHYEAKLERQNERLDEFASVISHDLRNPLNVAFNRIELAQYDCESEHLEKARQSLDRMEQLIGDVLTLTRQDEAVGETERISLAAVGRAAWDQVESQDGDLSVESDLSFDGDASRVQQLLENLFRNALDHGGDDVTIRVGACDGGFYVEDTGPGFPEDAREKLFKSGFTTAEDGTGLGLAIVKRIADAHGWEISATNGADGGARVEITDVTSATRPAVTGFEAM